MNELVFLVSFRNEHGDGSEFPLIVISGVKTPKEAIEAAAKSGRLDPAMRGIVMATEILVITADK